MSGTWSVAALYVDPAGPYGDIAAEVYDQDRDAQTFPGGMPVVAHPPCGMWGKLAWRCKQDNKGLGIHAVQVVRECGGVLEHPVGSRLFAECGISVDGVLDQWGGYTIRAEQLGWGHRGRKDTIFYIAPGPGRSGEPVGFLPPLPERGGEFEIKPVQNMGKLERRLTPPALAWWLCSVAYRTSRPDSELWPDKTRSLS